MLTLKSILEGLSTNQINKIVATGVRAAGSGSNSGSNSESNSDSDSNSDSNSSTGINRGGMSFIKRR